MTRYRTTAIIAAAATLTGVAAVAAATTPTWHTGVAVSAESPLTAGALGANGDALAAGAVSIGSPWSYVEVASRKGFTGPWVDTLLTNGLPTTVGVAAGLNDTGTGVVAWRLYGGHVRAAYRAGANGSWVTATVPYGYPARSPDDFGSPSASVAANGAVTLNWVARENTGWAIRSAFRSGPRAAWRATPGFVVAIPTGHLVRSVSVAGNAAGDAVATWRVTPASSQTGTVYVAVRAVHHAWGSPVALPGTSESAASVAISTNRRTVVTWSSWHVVNGVNVYDARLAKSLATSGHWTAPVWLTPGIVTGIAINSHGALSALVAVPRATTPVSYVLSATVSPNGTTWTPQTVLSRSRLTNMQVTLGNSGQAAAAFTAFGVNLPRRVRLATARLSGAWTGTSLLGQSAVGLTADQTGQALALTATAHGTAAASFDGITRLAADPPAGK